MSSYRNTRRDEAVANEFLGEHLPCRKCQASTDRNDLGMFGGQCRGCYDAYCAELNPSWWPNRPLRQHERQSLIVDARKNLQQLGRPARGPRAWAHDLKAREDAGEVLSPVQQKAWRDALHYVEERSLEA